MKVGRLLLGLIEKFVSFDFGSGTLYFIEKLKGLSNGFTNYFINVFYYLFILRID